MTSSSMIAGSMNFAPPWTTRCPTASAGAYPSTGDDALPSTRWRLRLVEPALTVSTARPSR
jgi:hypothetical protein